MSLSPSSQTSFDGSVGLCSPVNRSSIDYGTKMVCLSRKGIFTQSDRLGSDRREFLNSNPNSPLSRRHPTSTFMNHSWGESSLFPRDDYDMGSHYESDGSVTAVRSDPILHSDEWRMVDGSPFYLGDDSDGISMSHFSLDPSSLRRSDQTLSGDMSDLDRSDQSGYDSQHISPAVLLHPSVSKDLTHSVDSILPSTSVFSRSHTSYYNSPLSRINLLDRASPDRDNRHIPKPSGSETRHIISDGQEILSQVHSLLSLGEFVSARNLLRSSLQDHFEDYGMISRALLVEERFHCLEGVLTILSQLQSRDDYKCLKVLVEACLIAARLGDIVHVNSVFEQLVSSHLGRQGNLALNHILFVHRSLDYQQALSLLHMYTHMYPKHGPLWFFSFLEQEHLLVVLWKPYDMEGRIRPMVLLQSYADALLTISHELQWKVFFVAAQMLLHTYVQFLLSVTKRIDQINRFHMCAKRVLRIAKYYTACSLQLCPPNLRWKVWLLAARISVFSTDRTTARRV